ncbi:predicted protein [Naegleria gruberi]|uniref:Predicted protein n=1 Tax=Naegleria gruberi TaxID=5762 RepID=D2W331_NAEGR|nr:uncharacterized protein NAEGRDRAFT_75802 [Naegleria gruberi]EFC36541.1 predicted protein [Naegleria gruberi]|eukprot:XP_002669285.1 predicted protein [Naegleria gruberi strain NEG-M]
MPSTNNNEPLSPSIVVEGTITTTPPSTTTTTNLLGRNVEHKVNIPTTTTTPLSNTQQQQNLSEPSTVINDVGNNQTTIAIQPSLEPNNQQEERDRDYDDDEEEEPDTKPRSRFRRFISHLFSKSSSFLMGYRFVNFPGLRAHNSIKDPYERLSIAYYSVYFVFHLFFSISSMYEILLLNIHSFTLFINYS